jgi:ParB-like chromosome segregation protein Spo0J
MARTTKKAPSRGKAWDKLTRALARGKPQPSIGDSLPLWSIRTIPEMFQVRDPNEADSIRHVVDLAGAIKTQGSVDPISVWWSGADWVCIDGHHRLAAYEKADAVQVKVKVEVGTPQAMLMLATNENKKNRLHMGTAERAEAAWRLTCLPEAARPSKKDTATTTGLGTSAVGDQRRVHASLTGTHGYTGAAVQDMTWREARRLEKGLTDGEPGGNEWEEREVEEMCKQLGKTWGTLHDSKVELFLRALQRWDRRLQERAASEWAPESEQEEADY